MAKQTTTTVVVSARKYEDSDDCLGAAAAEYAAAHGLDGWQVSAAWVDDANREEIALTVPAST